MSDLLDPFDSENRLPEMRSWHWLLVGVVIGALVTGLGWAGVNAVQDRNHSPGGAAALALARSRAGATGCQAVYAEQKPVLAAAAASMAQWEVHVGAMNKLVAGNITLAQATTFWNQTRVGAQQRLADFHAALDRYRSRTARCPGAENTARVEPRAGTCTAAVAEQARVIRSAARALGTWDRHVQDMEMLRSGAMTATQASSMWLANWHKGARQIATYRSRVSAVDATC